MTPLDSYLAGLSWTGVIVTVFVLGVIVGSVVAIARKASK